MQNNPEADEGTARRIGQGLGRRQADPEPGVRAGTQPHGHEIEVTGGQSRRAQHRAHAQEQGAAMLSISAGGSRRTGVG